MDKTQRISKNESLGRQKWRHLKILNEEIREATSEKKEVYLKWLNSKDIEHYIIYKHKRAIVRNLPRKLQNESWKAFVKFLEKDVTGAKRYGFKVFKNLKEDCSDTLNINGITTVN